MRFHSRTYQTHTCSTLTGCTHGSIGTRYRLGTMRQQTSADDPGVEKVAAAASQQSELQAGVDVAEIPPKARGCLHKTPSKPMTRAATAVEISSLPLLLSSPASRAFCEGALELCAGLSATSTPAGNFLFVDWRRLQLLRRRDRPCSSARSTLAAAATLVVGFVGVWFTVGALYLWAGLSATSTPRRRFVFLLKGKRQQRLRRSDCPCSSAGPLCPACTACRYCRVRAPSALTILCVFGMHEYVT